MSDTADNSALPNPETSTGNRRPLWHRLATWFIGFAAIVSSAAAVYDFFAGPSVPECSDTAVQDTLNGIYQRTTQYGATFNDISETGDKDGVRSCKAKLLLADPAKTRGELTYHLSVEGRQFRVVIDSSKET